MPKAFLFGIKIENKSWKTRRNLLAAKSVIKTLRTEDRNRGQRRWWNYKIWQQHPIRFFDASIVGGIAPHTCEWDLGDGTTVDTCNVSHTYENPGTYTATISVTDATGQTASDSTPPLTITNTGGGEGGDNTITVEELPADGEAEPPTTNATAGQ